MTAILSSRFLSSAAFALVTTIALFLTMKVLVTGRDYEIEKELMTVGIDFVRVERDEDVNTKDRAMKRPSQQKPEEPPPPPKLQQTQRPNMDKASMSADFGLGLSGMNLNGRSMAMRWPLCVSCRVIQAAPCRAALKAGCCWNLPLMNWAKRLNRLWSMLTRKGFLTALPLMPSGNGNIAR